MLLPYELRFIARLGSKGPDRFVIDLGKPGSNKILKPEKYFSIARLESIVRRQGVRPAVHVERLAGALAASRR